MRKRNIGLAPTFSVAAKVHGCILHREKIGSLKLSDREDGYEPQIGTITEKWTDTHFISKLKEDRSY